jgi:hypothetical protein
LEQVILEFLKDSGRRSDYTVFRGLTVRIGRGYDNDLIVSDDHVSEHHCVIRVHEGGFTLEDLSSINGTWVIASAAEKKSRKFIGFGRFGIWKKSQGSKVKVDQSLRVHSGDTILIGHTRLRFIVSGHAVEPAKPIVKPNAFFEEINSAGKSWLLLISALMLSGVIEHQESYTNLTLSKFISIGIGLLLTFMIWSGIWSFIGWLIKRKAYFNAHLSWAALFFLSMSIVYPLADQLGYMTSSQIIEMAVGSFIFWVLISMLIAGHLMIATFIARRYQITVAVLLSLTIIIFGIVTYYAGKSEFNAQPGLYSTLVPPYGRIVVGDSVDQFLQKSAKIFLIKTNEH